MVRIEKKWYMNTSAELKTQLENLGESYAGFVNFLAGFPDEVGDVEVVRLVKLAQCNFSLIAPVFEVRKGEKVFTYEFASWKMGQNSGSKGILFLQDGERITHFVLLRQSRFAIHADIVNAIGGFTRDGDFSLSDTMRREIEEEVGCLGGDIEVHDLGAVYPDAGMVNSHVRLFAAFTTVKAIKQKANADGKELKSETICYPIGKIKEIVSSCDDGYFLAIIARLWAQGRII